MEVKYNTIPNKTDESLGGHRPLNEYFLHVGDKLPVQRGFFKNGAGDLLPALRFLGRVYNFYNFIIIFSLL